MALDGCWFHVESILHYFYCLLHHLDFACASINFALCLDRPFGDGLIFKMDNLFDFQ